MKTISLLRYCLPPSVALALVACGGGGGGGGPDSTPAPPNDDNDVTLPDSSEEKGPYVTGIEYTNSTGPAYHGALTAYLDGATGRGVLAGIVDTGIDADSHEFTGRIDAGSFDATGARRGIDDVSGHGSLVARLLAAANDRQDVHGIAYDAGLFIARADSGDSCASTCEFYESAVAAGVRGAADAGAKVINLSLGGDSPIGSTLRDAISDATGNGAVIVVAAGNDGREGPASGPTNFATSILAAGGDKVIIVGSVDDNGDFSAFSNRAGSARASFLSALGEDVCCGYESDHIRTT